MKVTWPRSNEYAQLYESAEWQDRLAGPRALFHGVLLAGGVLLMVFAAWACVRFSRFF